MSRATLDLVTCHVGDMEVRLVSHWTDGTKSTQWIGRDASGLWLFIKLAWAALRAGVRMEVVE